MDHIEVSDYGLAGGTRDEIAAGEHDDGGNHPYTIPQ